MPIINACDIHKKLYSITLDRGYGILDKINIVENHKYKIFYRQNSKECFITGKIVEVTCVNNIYKGYIMVEETVGINAYTKIFFNQVFDVEDITPNNAYEMAVEDGFTGTYEEWKLTLKGTNGLSAYEVAKKNGYTGTESEWLSSIVGAKGSTGDSAYQIAVKHGYDGTEEQWITGVNNLFFDAITKRLNNLYTILDKTLTSSQWVIDTEHSVSRFTITDSNINTTHKIGKFIKIEDATDPSIYSIETISSGSLTIKATTLTPEECNVSILLL